MKCPIALSITTLALLSSLTACSTTAPTPRLSDEEYAQRLAIFRDNAGEPVSVIHNYYFTWTPLGDATIAIWQSPEKDDLEGYLIEFTETCSNIKLLNPDYDPGYDDGIRAARYINSQLAEGDAIFVFYNDVYQKCYIKTIQPLDERRLAEQMLTLPRQDGLFEFEQSRGLIANKD
jgi:hypothetical protein